MEDLGDALPAGSTYERMTADEVSRHIQEDGGRQCEWVYDTPDRLISPAEVRMTCIALRRVFQKIAATEARKLRASDEVKLLAAEQGKEIDEVVKEKMPSAESIRERIVASSARFAEFARTNQNKQSFELVCDYKLTTEDFQDLLRLCTLREMVNDKVIQESDAKGVIQEHTRRKMIIKGLTMETKREDISPEDLRKAVQDLESAIKTPDALAWTCRMYKRG